MIWSSTHDKIIWFYMVSMKAMMRTPMKTFSEELGVEIKEDDLDRSLLILIVLFSGLDGKDMWAYLHAPTHTILKTQVWFVKHLKCCVVCFSTCFRFIRFLQSSWHFAQFPWLKCLSNYFSFTFLLSYNCCRLFMYLLLRCSAYKALQVFLLFVYVTRNTADVTTLNINFWI